MTPLPPTCYAYVSTFKNMWNPANIRWFPGKATFCFWSMLYLVFRCNPQSMVKKIQKLAILLGLNYFCCLHGHMFCRTRWISSFGKSYMVSLWPKIFWVVSVKILCAKALKRSFQNHVYYCGVMSNLDMSFWEKSVAYWFKCLKQLLNIV